MILSDRDIKSYIKQGKIKIKPMAKITTNGIDLTIADEVGIDVSVTHKAIDPTDKRSIHGSYEIHKIPKGGYLLEPREFYLLRTRELVAVDNSLIGIIKLKSSWARLGLLIPPTVLNAGSSGEIVAEIFNFRNAPLLIKRGMPFLHILFEKLSSNASASYSSVGHYYDQKGIRLPNPIRP